MKSIRAWCLRVAALFGGARRDEELAAELESHIQLHTDDNIRAGMTPEAARRAAILALGGIEATRERYRDRRGIPIVDTLRQDFAYAGRVLRRSPGFTAIAVVTIALGIGANSAIFSLVNAVLLRPLPFRDPGRLVLIYATDIARGNRFDVTSYPSFADWRDQSRTFEAMGAYAHRSLTLGLGDGSVAVGGARVTPGLFELLGVMPALGRPFIPQEQEPASSNVVVLSHGFWQAHFGGSADAIGQTVRVNDEPHTVIGVMPAAFHIEDAGTEELYLPLPVDPSRGHQFIRVLARLRAGVTMAQARADMDRVAALQTRTYPRDHAGVGVNVQSLNDGLARDARFGLYAMLAVVGLVLLIACANVAGLMLARGSSRHHELAIRAALGAGRARLVRQLLIESMLLAAAGGALGLIAAHWSALALSATLARQFRVPGLDAVNTDARVLAFTAVVSLATAVLFGAVPAFVSTSPQPNDALRDGTRSSTGRRAPRLRSALVVLETTLALVLLASAGTLMKTFRSLSLTHPGFEAAHVLTVDLRLPQSRFARLDDQSRFIDAATRTLSGLPGVRSIAFVADLPLGGDTDSENFHIPGRADPAPGKPFSSGFNVASAGYFQLMGIPVKSGREFASGDGPGAMPVAVVNETAARTFWPDGSPLGHQIELPLGKSTFRFTVIGVTGDVRHVGLGVPPRPEIFFSSSQSPFVWPWMVLVVGAHGDPGPLAASVTLGIHAADPNVPIQRVNTLDAVVSRSIAEPRLYTVLLGTFAALAVILSAVGLYGLIAYTVSERTHELGVRLALGAGHGEIVRLVLTQGLRLALVGAGLGIVAALAATRALVGLVKGVTPNDPVTLVLVTAVLLASALLASYLPARRAARVDPIAALRAE